MIIVSLPVEESNALSLVMMQTGWGRISLCSGEVSEWSKEAVLKTVEPLRGSGGSNPSLSGHFSPAPGHQEIR